LKVVLQETRWTGFSARKSRKTFMSARPRRALSMDSFAPSFDAPSFDAPPGTIGPDALDPSLEAALNAPRTTRSVSPFEFLPGWFAYGPVVAQWIALGLRHGDFSLPTAANPRITTGGLCGESKTAILDLVNGAARNWLAPYTTLVTADDDLAAARAAMSSVGLSLPLVIKPDIGCNGTGVRLVETEAALARALAAFPRGVTLVLQRLIPWEGEAGIFYIRHPDDPAGRISSLTLKFPPLVIGDGKTPLRELILRDPRHGKLRRLYLRRLEQRLDDVPVRGERVRLVFAGNHCKGSIFRNGAAEITPALTARIEAIARCMPDFHFGRIDVRYADLASLRQGLDFSIIEINGVGSEATHIWDPETPLREVFSAQFKHYAETFRIGAAMRARGAKTSGLMRMLQDWRMQRRLMASYPLND
jgi:hypothetical protein